MRWDLGITGLGLLAAMSLGFGLIAHLIVGKGLTRWLWLLSAVVYFMAGILVSEVWFGWSSTRKSAFKASLVMRVFTYNVCPATAPIGTEAVVGAGLKSLFRGEAPA